MLLITGEDENGLDLSETGYKLALTLWLKGEASDYVLTYKDKPLLELIGILEARFKKRQYKSDWIQKLKKITKQDGKSMITAIERLKYYVTKANLNKSSGERAFLESNIIIGKLKEVVSREMWMKIMEEKKKNKERGLEFNVLDALLIAEYLEKLTQEEYTPLVGIHNIELTSPQKGGNTNSQTNAQNKESS